MFEDTLRKHVDSTNIQTRIAAQGLSYGYSRSDGTFALALRALSDTDTQALLEQIIAQRLSNAADIKTWLYAQRDSIVNR